VSDHESLSLSVDLDGGWRSGGHNRAKSS
jgi:hypothetical protein